MKVNCLLPRDMPAGAIGQPETGAPVPPRSTCGCRDPQTGETRMRASPLDHDATDADAALNSRRGGG
jgi:hypothetical protein